MAKLLVVMGILLSLTVLLINAQQDNQKSPTPTNQDLFGSTDLDISPEETLKRLQNLSEIYEKQNNTNKLERMQQLIKQSEIYPNACECRDKDEYHYLRFLYTRMPTITNYLESYAHKQFELCQQNYVRELNETIAKNLDSQDIQSMTNLTKEVNEVIKKNPNFYRTTGHQDIAQGAINYLKHNRGSKANKFSTRYNEQVKGLCQRVLPTIRTQMRGNFNLQCLEESSWDVDATRSLWMRADWICNAFAEVEYSIVAWINYYLSVSGYSE